MMAAFTILHTIASLKSVKGGPSVSVSRLCEILSEKGLEVDLLSQKDERTPGDCVIPDLRCGQVRFIDSLPSWRKAIISEHRRKHYKLVHDHGIWLPCNHMVSSVSKRLGIPFIVNPRGMLEPWALSYKGWKKRIAWRLYQRRDLARASVLIATSVQEASAIRRMNLKAPVAIIPNGIDLPSLTPVVKKNENKTALFLSRIHPVKGLLNLVEAWAKARPSNWQVIVAGPDEKGHRSDVERAILEAGLKDQFLFAGAVSDQEKAALYRKADLFILPTFSENFGVVVAEALSYGVPVITTKGAPWECLRKHSCGWWVDINAEALAAVLREATALSWDELGKMGQRGRQYVEKEFTWNRVGEELMSIYRWVLGQGKKPGSVWEGH